MPHLLFSKKTTPFFQVKLQSSTTRIGRSAASDVVLGEPEISRDHASVYSIDGQHLLKTLGTARIAVNGQEVENHRLKDGDQILIGPWEVTFLRDGPESDILAETQGSPNSGKGTHAVANHSRGMVVQDLSLRVQGPGIKDEEYKIKTPSLTLGADPKNDVVIDDHYVSSRHLKITQEEGSLWVYDLGSTNGTYLNGNKIREAELAPGAEIKIGQCLIRVLGEEKLEKAKSIPSARFQGLVGATPGMQNLYGLLEKLGPSEGTVLILGESGTGKELAARAVHQLSGRSRGPFVAINCGAISRELIESELFGHEKGAFTGALRRHEGAFAQARGGTLFLDEIAELPLDLQPKLLRVLENKTYRLVGGKEEFPTDVRLVAATHQDLSSRVQSGNFRKDLFFRLFVLPLQILPLRERLEDIPLLAETFLQEFAVSSAPKQLSSNALKALQEHSYPGNVRELRNILLRSVVLSQDREIKASDIVFPDDFGEGSRELSLNGIEKLEEMERRMVIKALNFCNWNKAKAAESLGVAKSTLFSKIKLYGLETPKLSHD